MRKSGALLLSCLVLLLANQTCSSGDSKEEEPRYKGKSLSSWMSALEDKDPKVRVQAVGAMQSFGPRAKAAIPRLIPMLKITDENIARATHDALVAMGAEAVPALTEAAKSKDKSIRWSAISTLDTIGPKAKKAVPVILKSLDDPDSFLRMSTFWALTRIAPESPQTLDSVIGALEDKDDFVSNSAACALTYLGPEISKAWLVAERMLKSKDQKKRERGMGVLYSIAQKNSQKFPDIIPVLIRGVRDENSRVRYEAVLALEYMRPKAEEAVPPLVEALKDPNRELQRVAKLALWRIDPEEIEQFRVTSPVARIKDPQKQARAALKVLLQTEDYNKKLRLLPKQLRHALSKPARNYLAGLLLAKLHSSRPLPVENIAPTSVISRVQAGKMRSFGWQPWLTQDVFLENGRCAWALEGLLDCKLPDFTEEISRDKKQLQAHILRAWLAVIRATLRTEKATKR